MIAVDPTETVLSAANGDFFLLLFSIMFLFCMGIAGFFVYQMPKQWEKSTERIIEKLGEVVVETNAIKGSIYDLSKKYNEHDLQAKFILRLNEDIKECVTGVKRN